MATCNTLGIQCQAQNHENYTPRPNRDLSGAAGTKRALNWKRLEITLLQNGKSGQNAGFGSCFRWSPSAILYIQDPCVAYQKTRREVNYLI